ncbi:MAG: hypothetical protein QOE19_702 [Actinomycetota bacterium]|nr:hypothetical protein [Actinomycetota bacterium]MDQ1665734.1 hypothetical protein [Actinomycetota bacterium]MDQ1671223.1 hypothetical protein [Actinomycetota bacterium]
MTDSRAGAVEATEQWFRRHGLPFFVEGREIKVDDLVRGRSLVVLVLAYFGSLLLAVPSGQSWPARLLYSAGGLLLLLAVWAVSNLARRHRALERPRRVGAVEIAVFALGPAAAVAVLRQDAELALGTLLGDVTVLAVVAAAEILDLGPIARWALGRTFAELGSLFPLVTRALPMLLLFTTFLFINTEVWQVSSALSPPVLWLAVAFFGALAVGFLLARLPEEVAAVNDELDPAVVRRAVAGTPLEPYGGELADVPPQPLTRRQRVNLLLVLLVTQIAQVLLLSVAVWGFFLAFGRVAISESVIRSWVGGPGSPHYTSVLEQLGFSDELLQVSIFLAAFSGLYFTVYAVTDATYREQFFTAITDELEKAIGVRAAYLALCRAREAPHQGPDLR